MVHPSPRDLGYDRETAFALLAAARGVSVTEWTERCFAVLLLENQLLRLEASDLDEFDLFFVQLGLKAEMGWDVPMKASLLREGFSSLDLGGFTVEFIRKLSRLNRVHESIRLGERDEVGWRYVLRSARDVSKLALARYVFTPDEVCREIVRHLQVSEGVRCSQTVPDAPEFETEILRRLCSEPRIYWVSERCGSELNALVEYPLTSAVVVIKPPGSDLEFEIKRAGTRGPRLLDVIRRRNGREAPQSHRLFGGSLGWLAQRESAAAGIFSRIYSLVHSEESPCSVGVMNNNIVTVPTAEGEVHILDYLTDEEKFGAGFDETRASMDACVQTFPWDTGLARASYEGEAGLTLQFIGQALPQQAMITGSSSFRLDRIALYLSEAGPEEYFRAGLGREEYTLRDVRWLADSVLEEILGEVVIPTEVYLEYAQYVADAFRVPANRKRADENYLALMGQIGKCWGTLLAVRGFSDGESFVLRNAGLKSVWRNGNWQVRIIFMDHDDLTVAGSRYRYLWPWREVSGMDRDLVHILGGPMGDDTLPGELGVLNAIYRVTRETADSGVRVLEESLRGAYGRTQSQLDSNRELQELFYPEFIARHRDFDELVPWFFATDPTEEDSWKEEAAAFLRNRQCGDELAAEYVKTVCHFRRFFERLSFLYSK